MATVPVVTGPSVAQQGLPSTYQTVPNAIGGAGEARARQAAQAAQAAGAYGEMRQKEQNREDLDVVFRAETALKDEYLKFERDELGKQGVDAKGASERAEKWWGEAQSRYGDGLTERQAFAFRRSATQLRQAGASSLGRHEQQQASRSLQEAAQARIGTAVEVAIADPSPERVAASRKEIAEAVGIAAKMAGYAPEVSAAKTAEALTLLHRGVVMRLADADPDAAKAYYYTHKKEISGGTRATLEQTLEREGRLTKAQEAADEIMVKFPDLAEAMAHVETTYQGEDEKAIKAEVVDRYTKVKASKNQMSQTAYETAMLHTVQGQKVPASVWSQMDDGHKAAIIEKRQAEAKARRAEAEGKPIKTDFTAWDHLNRMVSADPQRFMSEDLGRYADKVSVQDRMEFANLQRKLREGGDTAKDVVTLQQQIGSTIDQLWLTGRQNTEKRGQLERSVVEAIRVEQRLRGKPLGDEDRQKVIDKQILHMTVDEPWYLGGDVTKRAFQLTPAERARATVVVPDEDRKLIREALKAKGRPVTDQAVLDLYKRQKGLP